VWTRRGLRGFAAAAARNQPPNVKRWRRKVLEASRADAIGAAMDASTAIADDDGLRSAGARQVKEG
jgi:hypothetical protein